MKKIYIELSDICTLSCRFCPAIKGKRGIMSVEDFRHCLKQALPLCHRIALHILGDPCYLGNLGEYLNVAREIGLQLQKYPKIDIVTSGAFFAKHSLDTLLSPPIFQLSISLEAGIDNFTKNPTRDFKARKFSAYLDSIATVLNAHKQNPQVFINLRIQDLHSLRDKHTLQVITHFLSPLLDFTYLAKQHSNDITQIKEQFLSGKIESLLDCKGRIRLWKKAFLVVKNSFVWAGFDKINERRNYKCCALSKQVGILSNGVVVPCCMDAQGAINLGNIFRTPLKQILSTTRAQNIIVGFKVGEAKENLCKTCGFWGDI